MKQQSIDSSSKKKNKLLFYRDVLILIASILLVLVATLYPFTFQYENISSWQVIKEEFNHHSSFEDQFNNILLFMPVGFGVATLLQRMGVKLFGQIVGASLLSASLSLTVECLQIFLPMRTPTPDDIFNNTIGGFFGFACAYIYDAQYFCSTFVKIENSKTSRSLPKILLFFLAYISLTLLIAIPWQNLINLNVWSENFPLMLGNEATADRPWSGYVSDLYITDKAIDRNQVSQAIDRKIDNYTFGDSLVSYYQFNGEDKFSDRAGNLPDLVWRGKLTNVENKKGVFLNSSHWLQTEGAVGNLNNRISKTSEFTLITTVATAETEQRGPARIVSVSEDTLNRNLTLGQDGSNLEIRVRTPLTGQNASDLKLVVPQVFADNNYHQIIVKYHKGAVEVYVDKLENYYHLTLLDLMKAKHKIFYFGFTFIPLGIILAWVTTLAKRKLTVYPLLMFLGIFLPSLMVEGLLATESVKTFSNKNLLIGAFVTAGTMLVFRLRAAMLKRELGS